MYGHEKRVAPAGDALDGSHAYRLKQWPEIPEHFRTARVLRTCSRMSLGPVTAKWVLNFTGLPAPIASGLMTLLISQGAVERIGLGPEDAGRPLAQRVLTQLAQPPVTRPVERQHLRLRVAHRFAWRDAALAALVCFGLTAALEVKFPADLGLIAAPNLPSLTG
jgi:hypothetical protein